MFVPVGVTVTPDSPAPVWSLTCSVRLPLTGRVMIVSSVTLWTGLPLVAFHATFEVTLKYAVFPVVQLEVPFELRNVAVECRV